MKRLILIRGPICAGKSTTVRLLQAAIGECSLLDQDNLKRTIDWQRPSVWRDRVAFDTTLYLADALMKRWRDIIADIHSAIPRQYNEYKKLAAKHRYRFFTVLLYPPLTVCLERNKRRVIPDVKYVVTAQDIEHYWKKLHQVKGELVIDTAKVKTAAVVRTILNLIQ